MGIVGKTAWMVAGALALLLALGFADPGNSRLMPSFFSKDPPQGVMPRAAIDEAGIMRAITQFNRDLSSAYLELDPALLAAAPMDDSLRRSFAEEIVFLRKDGRAMEMTVRDIEISEVRRLQNLMLSVDTVEFVTIRYLNASDRRQILAHPATRYAMNYTLAQSGTQWKIEAIQTLSVGKHAD